MGILSKVASMLGRKSADDRTANALAEPSDNALDMLIDQLLELDISQKGAAFYYAARLQAAKECQVLLNLSESQRVAFMLKVIPIIEQEHKHYHHHFTLGDYADHVNDRDRSIALSESLTLLIKSTTIFKDADVESLMNAFYAHELSDYWALVGWPVTELLSQLKKQYKKSTLSVELAATLSELGEYENTYDCGPFGKSIQKLVRDLLLKAPSQEGDVTPVLFANDDDFASYANAKIGELTKNEQHHWYRIITLAQASAGAKPSAKFLSASKELIEALGTARYSQMVRDWFEFIVTHKDTMPPGAHFIGHFLLSSANVSLVKPLVWMCAHLQDEAVTMILAKLAERCYQVIPNTGLASQALGNACFYALYKTQGLDGISQLSRLKLRIKTPSAHNLIDKYLQEVAETRGVSMSALEDFAVPDFGLVDEKRSWQLNDYTAQLSIIGVGKTALQWVKSDGSLQKTMPVIVKETFAEEVKDLKNTAKQIEQMLTAQRDRIDGMFRANRTMPWAHFELYFLKHPLMGYLAKNIIWNLTENGQTVSAVYLNGVWTNNSNEALKVTDQATVSLWHPAISSVENTHLWRDFFLDHLIAQPLKQAYREVYWLTEAEANTKSYSNRMAAHILKQYQLSALAKGRGWQYSLMGTWDGGDYATAETWIDGYEISAQFMVQSVQENNAYSESGIWNYAATDQVRFLNATTDEVLDLVDVPALVFSEIMRDVDLFVGVASVGNDPNWQDSGDLPAYGAYWRSYSFGDLSELAKTRKEVLARLLPKLKIKDVAEIKDKFLVVKGKLRTYKIHMGSTNILMEPNDQYLCIVPNQHLKATAENVFLPFEGDSALSIVISKAFLLAEDDKITDSSITSQILYKA